MLLGASARTKAECHGFKCVTWQKYEAKENISEHSVVVIRFEGVSSDTRDLNILWNSIADLFDSRRLVGGLSKGLIVILIGDPHKCEFFEVKGLPFTHATGVHCAFDNQTSTTVRALDSRFEKIVNMNFGESRATTNEPCPHTDLTNVAKGLGLSFELHPIACNRMDDMTAWNLELVKVDLRVVNRIETSGQGFPYQNSEIEKSYEKYGQIVFLPESSLDDEDLLRIISSDVLKEKIVEPDWIAAFKMPGEEECLRNMAEIDEENSRHQILRQNQVELLQRMRLPLKLLYSTDKRLEVEVRDAFRELGCNVTDPLGDDDDGLLDFDGLKFALEVKSSANKLCDTTAIKQAALWKAKFIEELESEVQGLVVVNPMASKVPSSRAKPFDDNHLRFAALQKVALMTSVDLFRLVVANRLGALDSKQLFNELFSLHNRLDVSKYSSAEVDGILD